MIKDKILRLIFVPFLALTIPYASGIITYSKYSTIELTGGVLYFIFVSYTLWNGCKWSHAKVRYAHGISPNPIIKIISIYLLSSLLTCIGSIIFCLVWIGISKEIFSWVPVFKFCLISILALIVFTLIYEIMYLTKEREIDNKIVDQLDNELTHAEITALRNELDPHFLFNSLNTLSHLISTDHTKADLFNNNLAEVYKYFLINKDNEVISADKEIEFIKKYFVLLQIRHDNKLQLHIKNPEEDYKEILIIPCALQILVENAIKHNEFAEDGPLHIYITLNGQYLNIQNSVSQKTIPVNSTRVGLRNLMSQYLLISKKQIIIQECDNEFIVKLPIIRSPKKL